MKSPEYSVLFTSKNQSPPTRPPGHPAMNKLNKALFGIFITVFLCFLTSVTAIIGARLCVEQHNLLTAVMTPAQPQPFSYSNYDYSYGNIEDPSPRSSSDRHEELLKRINNILGERRYPDAYYSIEPQGNRDMSDDAIYHYLPRSQPWDQSPSNTQDDALPQEPELRIPFDAFPPLILEGNKEDQGKGAEKQPEYGLYFVR